MYGEIQPHTHVYMYAHRSGCEVYDVREDELYIDKSCTIEVGFGAKLQLTGSQVTGEWGDISYVPHTKEGLKKTLKPKSKSSMRHCSKSAKI